MQPDAKTTLIVIYDGYCGFCYRIIRFIETRDKEHRLLLLPRQSEQARSLLQNEIGVEENESVLVFDSGTLLRNSDATMRIWQELGGVWSVISWLRVVPRPIRDWVYGFIARNRYHWFGRYDTCQWPGHKQDDVP